MDKKEQRGKPGKARKLIRTQQESNRLKIFITIAVILVIALAYYLIDSGSYVATVNNNRITKAEYQFFLSQQKSTIEQEQGLLTKTEAEQKDFWTKTTDGQNPWEDAKSKALDASKEYMIQLIKAQEAGLKITSDIKSEVAGILDQYKGTMTDKDFEEYVKTVFNINSSDLSRIMANLTLAERFMDSYLDKNYTAPTLTDEEIKAYYDKDAKLFDTIDISYITLSKIEDNKEITAEQLEAKKKKADEALARVKNGEDMDKLITEYTEDAPATDSTSAQPIGKATVTYTQNPLLQNLIDWVFANKPGDASVIETDYTIYVVKINSRSTFEDAKAVVKNAMEAEAKQAFYDEALKNWSMESKYNIIKNDRVYDSINYVSIAGK